VAWREDRTRRCDFLSIREERYPAGLRSRLIDEDGKDGKSPFPNKGTWGQGVATWKERGVECWKRFRGKGAGSCAAFDRRGESRKFSSPRPGERFFSW